MHADIGGGYPEAEGGLWRIPFEWIAGAAKDAGLQVDDRRWKAVWDKPPVPERPWDEPQHESLTPLWWLAEFFPKMQRRNGALPLPRLGLGRRRYIPNGALIHQSTLRRIRETNYAAAEFLRASSEKGGAVGRARVSAVCMVKTSGGPAIRAIRRVPRAAQLPVAPAGSTGGANSRQVAWATQLPVPPACGTCGIKKVS